MPPCQQTLDKTKGFHWPLGTLARNGLNIKWYHCVTHFVCENELRFNPGSFYPYSPQVAMSLCAHHQNKKTEQNSKTPQLGLYFLSTLYLSSCLGIHGVQITGNCICQSKKKKKKSPQVFSWPPDRRKLLSPFQAVFFLNLSLWGPFSPNMRKNEFSAKIRLC